MQILIQISVLVMCIIILLDLVSYYSSSSVIIKDSQNYTGQITAQISRNIEYYVNYMEDISFILNNEAENYNDLTPQQISKNGKDNLLLKTITKIRSDINSIYVFHNNTVLMTDQDSSSIKKNINISQLSWYKNAVNAKGSPVFSSSYVENFIEGNYPWVVSLSRAIYDQKTSNLIGVALIDINFKVFTDLCSKIQLGDTGYVFIIDEKGNIIYHPKQELIYSKIKIEPIDKILKVNNGNFTDFSDNSKKLITVQTLHSIGWKVVGVTYMSDILIQTKVYMTIIFIATLLCLILAVIISKKIAKNISDPLAELEKIMNQFEAGEAYGDIEIYGNNEIAQLSQTFSNMSRRIKNLLQKIEEDQAELRKSELKALYAQINPHLLYNSLDTIIWAAEQNENDKVIKMTSALAKYFRLSLSKGREVVPVFMEIEHIKNYLIIQKIRYDQMLEYEIDVDKDILVYNTLIKLIQPIVENAIYHGIKNLPGGGKIWIFGKRVDNNINLIIKDNGVGMDEQQLETILTKKINNNLTTGGVAIPNVHQRIQLYYGKDYGLKFESKLGEGTTVTIVIPIVDQGKDGKYE